VIRYFAYGSDLHRDSIADWCKLADRPLPRRDDLRPAVLTNHRICFPAHETFWQGGVADIVSAPGKSVSGALMEISAHGLETLERMPGRSRSNRMIVRVTPYAGGPPVEAITFRIGQPDLFHVPPTTLYLERLTEAAAEIGLSMMWVMHLQSFPAIPVAPREEEIDADVEVLQVSHRLSRRARRSPNRAPVLLGV
jgi:gamma-glutamylcyclotransferase